MDLRRALAIIDAACERCDKVPGGDKEVVEALRFLTARGVERETLVWFWEALSYDNYIGRWQNANASRNRIKFLLGWHDVNSSRLLL